jgi:hypothetical protein
MLINWTTKIEGSRVILVPYCKHHVPKYHEWMKVLFIKLLFNTIETIQPKLNGQAKDLTWSMVKLSVSQLTQNM